MRISDWSSDVCSSDLAPTRHKVPPGSVVDVAVALVVNIVAGGFAGIHKEVRHKVGMRHVEAAIDDGNDGAGISGFELPSKVPIYIRVLKPVVLPCVVYWPLPVDERVFRLKFPSFILDVQFSFFIFHYSFLFIYFV